MIHVINNSSKWLQSELAGIKGGEDFHLSKTYNIFYIWFAHKNGELWILHFAASNDQIIFVENYFISLSNASAPYEKHKTTFTFFLEQLLNKYKRTVT